MIENIKNLYKLIRGYCFGYIHKINEANENDVDKENEFFFLKNKRNRASQLNRFNTKGNKKQNIIHICNELDALSLMEKPSLFNRSISNMLVDSSKADFDEDVNMSSTVTKIMTKFKKNIKKSEFKELFTHNAIESLLHLMNPEKSCSKGISFDIKEDLYLRNSIKTLNKTEWLDDIIISTYANLIAIDESTSKSIVISNTYFINLLLNITSNIPEIPYDPEFKKASKQLNKKRSKLILNDSKDFKILQPVNISNSHWLLMEIDVLNNKISVYDSFEKYTNKDEQLKIINKIVNFIKIYKETLNDSKIKTRHESHYEEINHIKEEEIEWEYENIDCPQQNNCYDCGVFTLKFLEELAKKRNIHNIFSKNMEFYRWEIGLRILISQNK